jgi:hypothetical protein
MATAPLWEEIVHIRIAASVVGAIWTSGAGSGGQTGKAVFT